MSTQPATPDDDRTADAPTTTWSVRTNADGTPIACVEDARNLDAWITSDTVADPSNGAMELRDPENDDAWIASDTTVEVTV